jgi:hypothetical protein
MKLAIILIGLFLEFKKLFISLLILNSFVFFLFKYSSKDTQLFVEKVEKALNSEGVGWSSKFQITTFLPNKKGIFINDE